MSERAAVRGVLFDLDGTLVDSLPTVAAAMSRALADFGYDFAPEVVLPLIGAPMPVLASELTGVRGDVADQMNARYLELYYDEFIDTTLPLAGAEELLGRLYDADVPLALVTNKNEDGARRMIEIQRWERYFDVIVGRDTTPRAKPWPDGSRFALAAIGVTARDASFVGDTEFDMQTGRDAEIGQRIGLLGARTPEELRASGATHIAEDLGGVGAILLEGAPATVAAE
ncbi:MAG: HAD family hydrolase [Chloroflexi bacterium]|nr:HAD family hydrolase [Chloroflexota bacterium]